MSPSSPPPPPPTPTNHAEIASNRLKSLQSHLAQSGLNNLAKPAESGSPNPAPGSPVRRNKSPRSHPSFVPPKNLSILNMSAPLSRPAITAHVLDTTLGLPAANIPVTLLSMPSISPPPPSPPTGYTTPFSTAEPTIIATATTNSDGRIAAWNFSTDEQGQKAEISTEKGGVYMLRFETFEYYKRKYGEGGGFFPWIDVVFVMGGAETAGADGRAEEERKHYHVPVLLSRFSYSTYRGS